MDENCKLRLEVSPRWGAATSAGFACGWTGGHCAPDAGCDRRRSDAEQQQRIYDEWIEEETAAKAHLPLQDTATRGEEG